EDGIRDRNVTGVQTCALPISRYRAKRVRNSVSPLQCPASIFNMPLVLQEMNGSARSICFYHPPNKSCGELDRKTQFPFAWMRFPGLNNKRFYNAPYDLACLGRSTQAPSPR